MPDSNNPQSPNFRPGVGRLVTDRYDFENHILGNDFRHPATAIDMAPAVTIDGYAFSTVQSAITALVNVVEPPSIALATASTPGLIQLSSSLGGDLQELAPGQARVVNIQGKPVSPIVPTAGQILTYTGSAWTPLANSNLVVWAGDLANSTNAAQYVRTLSGDFPINPITNNSVVTIEAPTLSWNANVTTINITQGVGSTTFGGNIAITAQQGTLYGGEITIQAGHSNVQSYIGTVTLASGDGNKVLQVGNTTLGHVITMFENSHINSTDLPPGVGDGVLYIKNATTPPGASATNGPLVYANAGQLWVRQSDTTEFAVGSIPNPSTWGTVGSPYNIGTPPAVGSAQEYSYRYSAQTTSNSSQVLNFIIPANTCARVDAIIVGKQVGATQSAMFNLSMGYLSDSSQNITAVGSSLTTSADPRVTSLAASWASPNISTTGSSGNIQVSTGNYSSTTIDWTIIVQMVLAQG